MNATNLVAWLPFDESTTADKCGNEWTATGSPTISETNSVTGKALQLNGSSYLQMNGSLTLGGQDFTVCGRFNFSSSSGSHCRIFSFHNANNTTTGCINLARVSTGSNLYTDCMGSSSSNFAVSLNENHFFAYVYQHDEGKVKIFIDGELKLDWSKTIARTNFPNVFIGKSNWNDGYPVGTIDEFQIFDGVALWAENFTPPTAADYEELAFQLNGGTVFTADVERVIKNDAYIKRIAQSLKVWLPFDESATADKCGNEWTINGSPTISETNSVTGKALQLNGSSYLQMNGSLTLGGQDFTIDGWFNLSSSTGNWPRVFALFNTTNSDAASIQLQRKEKTTNFQVCCNGAFSETFSVSLNTRHHFELDYVHSTSTVYVFIDGALMKTFTKTMDVTTYATVSLGLSNFTTDAKFIGTIDEFQIYDGVALHTENFTPPTAEFYDELAFQLDSLVEFTVDVERRISNRVEFTADVERKVIAAWRYFNAGTADTLTVEGTTLENLSDDKSVTGTAFYQTTQAKCFDLPPAEEIWIKFDVYFDGSNRWRAYNGGANGTTGITAQTNNEITYFTNGANNVYSATNAAKKNQLQTVILHMISGATAGVIETWVDGTKIYTYTGDVNHGEDFADIYLQSDGAGTFFSNVIISNKELTFGDGYQKFTADVERRTTKRIEFTVDVEREVRNDIAVDFVADVEIIYFLPVTFAADVERRVTVRSEFAADVEIFDVIPVEFTADVIRAIKAKVKLFAVDSSTYFPGSSDSGTLNPVVIPPQETIPAAPDNTIGLQSIEISLSEQQLTDNIAFVGVVPFDIMYPVKGQYLDYVFDMRVERVQQKGILYSCECCSDVDQLLYTQLAYTVPQSTDWHSSGESTDTVTNDDKSVSAKFHASSIARTLGKTAVIQFDDFASTVLTENLGGATYADLIRDVFGWSSRVPTQMINVFIRDDKIYFVQRGHEARLIDLSGTKHTIPTITHELVRMTWGSTPWSKTETREVEVYRPSTTSTSSSGTGDNSGGSGGTGSIGGGSGSGSGTGGGTGTGDNPGSGSGSGTGTGTDDTPGSGSGSGDITIEEPDDGGGNEKNAWLNVGKVTTEDSNGVTVTTYTYDKDGVLKKTVAEFTSKKDAKESNTKTTITNYNDDGLVRETSTTVEYPADRTSNSRVVTTYGYLKLSDGKKFLSTEMVSEYDANDKLVDQRVTTKSPTGRGQGTSDDDAGGSSGSGNIGDDRVTPYQRAQASKTSEAAFENALGDYDSTWDKALNDYTSSAGTDPVDVAAFKKNFDDSFNDAFKSDHESNYYTERQSRTLNGLSLYDSSFPIHNVGKLVELTAAIKWLNRRTKETVTFSLYEYPHLIDFNDRILFNGSEYFLVSNIATTNARIFNEQRVTFTRWY